jgi:hypothetical protein
MIKNKTRCSCHRSRVWNSLNEGKSYGVYNSILEELRIEDNGERNYSDVLNSAHNLTKNKS